MPDGPHNAMDRLSRDARFEARMLEQDKAITAEQREQLTRELTTYRDTHMVGGKPVSWAKLASYVGVSPSVLTETVRGSYKGDVDAVLRKIDQFLANEIDQASGPDFRDFQKIRITEYILGAIRQALTMRSIAVITGEPGSGKSEHARWFCGKHDGAVMITSDSTDYDAKFIIDYLHQALGLAHAMFTRDKKRAIETHLQRHINTVLVVDEAQKLNTDALEILRALHDKSDPTGRRNVPVILFGDDKFYEIVVSGKGDKKRSLSPQITRRFYPVISIERHCAERDDDGRPMVETTYTRQDIETIVNNRRLRLFRPEAIAWLTKLANLEREGRLGTTIRVAQIAAKTKTGAQVTIGDLTAALDLFTPTRAALILQSMNFKPQRPEAVAAAG